MAHESLSRQEEVRTSSNRSFGLVISAVLALIGVVPWLFGGRLHYWAVAASLAFLLAGLVAPATLGSLNRVWTRFGLLLHRIVSPVVLGVMFFLVVAPTGLLMRALGKDPLRLKFDRSAQTYWIPRDPPGPAPEGFKDQF